MAPTQIRESIPEIVSSALAESEISQPELARRTGINKVTLQRKLAGVGDFSVSEMVRIAPEVGADPAEWASRIQVDAARGGA